MNLFKELDTQLFFLDSCAVNEMFNSSLKKYLSITIFFFSLVCKTLADLIVSQKGLSNFYSLVGFGILGKLIIIILFLIWVTFCSAVLRKQGEMYTLLYYIFSSHSVYLVLLPISIIFTYFNLTVQYYFIETVVFLILLNRVIRYTKLCYGFTKGQMWLIIFSPIILLTIFITLPVILVLFSTKKIINLF